MASMRTRVILVVGILLFIFLLPLLLRILAIRLRGNSREVKRCILKNDHAKLHKLLERAANRRCVMHEDVDKAMEQGYLEVIQEISAHSDIISTISESGVEKAIKNGRAHIVRYILSSSSLQNIILKNTKLLDLISGNDKMLRESVTDKLVPVLLRAGDSEIEHLMSNGIIRKHLSGLVLGHLMKPEGIESAKSWSSRAWRVIYSSDITKLLEACTIDKLICIMECSGAAETLGCACLRKVLSEEHSRALLWDAFIENKQGRLRDAIVMCAKSARGTQAKLLVFLLWKGKTQDSAVQVSYEEICNTSTDSIVDEGERAIVERLSRIPEFGIEDANSIYRLALFLRKIRSEDGQEELRGLGPKALERLHRCLGGEEAETGVELAARRLEKKREQVLLSTHEFYMMYAQNDGRYLKADGMIKNCLSANYCSFCRKPLADEEPGYDEDMNAPLCPVCENGYGAGAECREVKYMTLACAHVYHSCCVDAFMKSKDFDNECPHELCQAPVVPGLSERDVLQTRKRNTGNYYVHNIKERAEKSVSEMMSDHHNKSIISFWMTGNTAELRRLLVLRELHRMLTQNWDEITAAGVGNEVLEGTGFNLRELNVLRHKYPWVYRLREYPQPDIASA